MYIYLFSIPLDAIYSILETIAAVMVYLGLKVAFSYGSYDDFGQESYGRDKSDSPLENHGWFEEIVQFLFITSFWLIVFFVRIRYVVYGYKIIFRSLGVIPAKRN